MMNPDAGDKPSVEGSAVSEFGRLRRDVRRQFEAEAKFRDRLEQARASARPAPLRGKRLRYAVADAFAENMAGDRAEAEAKELALTTVAELAAVYRDLETADPDEPGHGVDLVGTLFGGGEQTDPLAELVDAVDESPRPEFAQTAVTILAQLGAAAVLQLAKDHRRDPAEVVSALLATYFPEEAED
jgi:hypothetical protein